jgi:hypothetical protein
VFEVKRNVLHRYKLVDGECVVSVDQWGKLTSMSRPAVKPEDLPIVWPVDWMTMGTVLLVNREQWKAITGRAFRAAPYSDDMRQFLERVAIDLNGMENT